MTTALRKLRRRACGSIRGALALSTLSIAAGAASDPSARELLLELTQETRLAGTSGSLVAARHVADRLREAGFDARIEDFEVLLSYPRRIELAIHPERGAAALTERIETFDPDAIPAGDVPLYNAWSASGDVTAEVVDVGRGLRADFERLAKQGVDVKGKIALCRYGGSYRGIKVDLATQFGCAGVLLFGDPASDGPAKGPTWPDGPWKHPYEAQRGSISPIGRAPGDPTTPGWASPAPGESARRIGGAELDAALPRIPCVPIGSGEALRIQALLAKRTVTDADGKSSEVAIGPGPAVVHLVVDCPRVLRTIHDVIGTLHGASEDCVIAGCHRDAWVRGANDDGSGVVCMLRAAQRLGERAQSGWKPPTSVVLAFWDAEEFGMIGSTEWGERHEQWIRDHCFAYVNSDTACQGTHFEGASGTPGLFDVLETALRRVPTPGPRRDGQPWDMFQDWCEQIAADAKAHPEAKIVKPRIGLAGSGSDFAVFLHHLSVPCVDVGLGGNSGGQYHTSFDDFATVERYLDPGFVGHELCGRILAELLSEMSQRGRRSFDDEEALRTISEIVDATPALGDGRAGELDVDDRVALVRTLQTLAEALRTRRLEGESHAAWRPVPIYAALERRDGLPGREWFRNELWTAGLEDGYGSELLPLCRAAARVDRAHVHAALEELRARLAALDTSTDERLGK